QPAAHPRRAVPTALRGQAGRHAPGQAGITVTTLSGTEELPRARGRPGAGALAGVGPLTRLVVRRDRLMLAAWIYLLTILVVSSAYSIKKLYSTAAVLDQFAVNASHNPALAFLYGPVYGHSVGG